MRKVILFSTVFLLLCGLASNAQSVLKPMNTKLELTVKLFDTSFTTADSVKLLMTVKNTSSTTQKVLFDKPLKQYPWSTNVSLYRKSGNPVKVTMWAFLSSQLYVEEQLKDYYRELRPGESISQVYYLSSLVRYDTKSGTLPKGTYTLRASFENNLSNKVSFVIR